MVVDLSIDKEILVEDEIQAGGESTAVGHGSGQAGVEVRARTDDGDLIKNSFGFRHSARAGDPRTAATFDLRPHTPLVRESGLVLLWLCPSF